MREWEAFGYNQMKNASFTITVDGDVGRFDSIITGFGENYPYRDHCKKEGDPQCKSGEVQYYRTTVPSGEGNTTIQIASSPSFEYIFDDTIPFETSVHLYKKDISCVGGNEYDLTG